MKLGAIRIPFGRRIARLHPRARILGWAAVIALVVGAIELGEPVESVVQTVRDVVRSHPSDGSVVVVRIDNLAIRGLKSWPPQRAIDAQSVDTLFALGARRVLYDRSFADPSPVGDDALFATAMKRHPGRVYLAARFDDEGTPGQREGVFPIDVLRRNAHIGSIVIWRNFMGYTSGIPFRSTIDGKPYPSFSSILSGRYSESAGTFRPDYSIDYRSIPSLSLADVLERSPRTSIVAGKDVIIGVTAASLGDVHLLPGQGSAPGVFVHVIGAETLRHGIPVVLGWVPFYLAAVGLAALYLFTKRTQLRRLVGVSGATMLLGVPFLLDSWGVETEVFPAALLLGIVVVRARILARVVTNPVTGLPKLDQVAQGQGVFAGTLVGLKIRNLADLRSTLSAREETRLFMEVVRRIRVGNPDLEVMQGDDSLVWKTDLDASRGLFDHVEALHAMLSMPIDLGTRRVDLAFAFGIDGDADRELGNRVASVLVSAGDALASGERWKVHDARRLDDADFRHSLLGRMEQALGNGEIWVSYQPKYSLNPKRVIGAEALVRWSDPERGMIAPDRFIPEAEAANRIAGLTAFVLETAIKDTASLDRIDPTFGVAVNLSVRLLATPGFADTVAALLRKYGLAPHRLTLEVTESAEIDFSGPALPTLHVLRDLGVKLSIDDYGTKYSTLDYVRQLPACEIKIDQRFIRSLHLDESARIMVRSTIELAHSLGLSVVAEGVELPKILVELEDMGCDVAQGYLIARPMPLDKLQSFLAFANPGYGLRHAA